MRIICIRCDGAKEADDFYRQTSGSLDKTCKICRCALVRARRKENPKVQEYDRNRGSRQAPGYLKAWRAKYPKKYKAHSAVNYAIRSGVLTNPGNCVECASDFAVEAHHDDYDFPLTVRWLCAVCHKRWHAEHGEALNGE